MSCFWVASACCPTRRSLTASSSSMRACGARLTRSCEPDVRSSGHLRQARLRRSENLLERLPEGDVDIRHGHGMAEIDQRSDTVARVDHATGHDGGEM